MKRMLLVLAACAGLLVSTAPVQADWVYTVDSKGWVSFHWDPAFETGDYYPPDRGVPPPPPPNVIGFYRVHNNVWWYITPYNENP